MPMWSHQLVKSCTIADRGDGASVGASGSCAWASAKPDNRKKREKLAVPNILSFIIIAPPSVQLHSELGRCLGQTACLRGRARAAISGEVADEGRGKKDRGEYCQAAGVAS